MNTLQNTSTKKLLFLIHLIVITIFYCCSPKKSQTQETLAKDSLTQVSADSFQIFLQNFPLKKGVVTFPSQDNNYNEENIKPIETSFSVKYLTSDLNDANSEQAVYYLARVQLHDDVNSVVVYKAVAGLFYDYILLNFDKDGQLLSNKTIAFYEYGTGIINRSTTEINGNKITIKDISESRQSDDRSESSSTYKINRNGSFLAVGIPEALITTFYTAVKKKGEYLISTTCMSYEPDDVSSEAFTLHQKGDSVFYWPFPDGSSSIASSFSTGQNVYNFLMRDFENPQHEDTWNLTMTEVKDAPGVYRLGDDNSEEYVIAQPYLSRYKIRKVVCNDEDKIVPQGLSGISLGYNKSFIESFSKRNNLVYKVEKEQVDGITETFHRLYNNKNNLVMELTLNPVSQVITSMRLMNDSFKTEGGISVGSTLSDLLYNHESVTATCGEDGVMVSIKWYKDVTFFINHIAGPPDSSVDLDKLDQNLKISRIDIL